MESIFHEKQEGYLCAQHCLNALLQGSYFNAVDLANLGHELDEAERVTMAESGVDSEDYKLFLEQPSGNMDDSGYFSVQVISSALKVWGLELVPYNSTEAVALQAQKDPSQMKAYICNYKGHWFTIRKLGTQWFDLNSMLSGPQLISDTYLAMYLAQLIQEGYSIFIVIGTLPQCQADEVLMTNPIIPKSKIKEAVKDEKVMPKGYRLGSKAEEEVMKAIDALKGIKVPKFCASAETSASSDSPLVLSKTSSEHNRLSVASTSFEKPRERRIPVAVEGAEEEQDDDENEQLQRALQLSLQACEDDVDKTYNLRLNVQGNDQAVQSADLIDDADQDDELRRALQMSLECVTAPATPNLEDLRWRRLNHFGMYSGTPNSEASPKLNS